MRPWRQSRPDSGHPGSTRCGGRPADPQIPRGPWDRPPRRCNGRGVHERRGSGSLSPSPPAIGLRRTWEDRPVPSAASTDARVHDSAFLRAARSEPVPHTAGVVHAAGRPVAAGVPRAARGRADARVVHAPGAGRGDHPAAGAPVRRGRGDLLLRHRAAAEGRRGRPGHQAGRRPGGGTTGRDAGRRRGDPGPDPRARAVHHRVGADAGRRAGRDTADRVRRCAVHGRVVPRRGRAVQGAREDQGDDVRRPRRVGRADGQDRRDLRGLPRGAGRGGRVRGAAVRLVGRRDVAGGLPPLRDAVLHPGARARPASSACRGSTSASAPASCSA